jgi:hypothetical protein
MENRKRPSAIKAGMCIPIDSGERAAPRRQYGRGAWGFQTNKKRQA